jgi:hypothetical protein
MAPTKSIWFHIGHAIERARHGAPTTGKAIAGFGERRAERAQQKRKAERKAERAGHERRVPRSESHAPLPSADDLMAAGVAMVVDRALGSWGRRTKPGVSGLLRAAAAGATAALLVDLVRPLLKGEPAVPVLDRGTADRMLSGAAQGLVYGAVIEPRVPGPALAKGALFGSVEYVADPMGGISGLLGSHAPQNRLPVVGEILEGLDEHDRAYLEHLVFGIALALLYESNPSSNGIRLEEE